MSWNKFFEFVGRCILGIICFIPRLLRDVWLGIWKPARRWLVKWLAPCMGVVLLISFCKENPDGLQYLLGWSIVFGFVFAIIKMIFDKFK